MNRNLDGRWLTAEEMTAIALDAGLMDPVTLNNHVHALHNPNLIKSFLSQLTAVERHRMWGRGRLILDTRTPANCPGYTDPTIIKQGAST